MSESRRQTHASPASGQRRAPRCVIITIDGPAGTGKSTMAQRLARRLGLEFLDTGAMYRAAAVIAKQQGIPLDDGQAVADALDNAALQFDFDASPPRLLATRPRPVDLTDLLRSPEITVAASVVAGCPQVRESLVRQQRRIGADHARIVAEGRDQGSVVFPQADVKFYLDATPAARAKRRARQLQRQQPPPDLEALRIEIQNRDHADRTRAVGPLVIPDGARVIDTTDLAEDEVLDLLENHVRTVIPNADFRPK